MTSCFLPCCDTLTQCNICKIHGLHPASPDGGLFSPSRRLAHCAENRYNWRKRQENRLSKNCQAKSIGGKKSVKGNRQGFLSRSITRRSGRIAKSCYKILFAIRKVACQRSPKGPWQARSTRLDDRIALANSKILRTSSRRNSRRDFFHLPHCILLKITGCFL